MEQRIYLTRKEKEVLRLLQSGIAQCPDTYPSDVFAACMASLERKGLARGAWASGYELVGARLTEEGATYLALNPKLCNPIDWKWAITTIIAALSMIIALASLFISCRVL